MVLFNGSCTLMDWLHVDNTEGDKLQKQTGL